ncbi:MAG: HDOD domain-containing protein [Deltaproteobacteria bacterium]|nr:HDOD domain-containing protein [Deltaproteobacteria bacterium]
MGRLQHESYGKGNHNIDDASLSVENDLMFELAETFGSKAYRPPLLPRAATELMMLSRNSDVSIEEVLELLETDALLAARVLKIASSPVYAGSSKLASLKQGIVRIGLNTLRDIVMEAALNMKVFRSKAHQSTMTMLRTHSRATAYACRVVARYTSIDGEFAFMCGLLHDVGISGALILSAEKKIGVGVAPHLLWEAVQAKHALGSQRMCEVWELPPEIQLAVGYHHDIEQDGFTHPLAAVIRVAEHFVEKAGVGLHESIDGGTEVTFEKACKALELDAKKLQNVEKKLQEVFSDILA